jgi:serine/threonine protein kinase
MAVALGLDPAAGGQPAANFGPFRVLDCLAEGGMAYVYRGLDDNSGRTVALKTVRTGAAPEVDGLVREIAALRRLHHPGVVRFLADGESNGFPWMAVELLEGRTLFDELLWMWTHPAAGSVARLAPPASLADRPSSFQASFAAEDEVCEEASTQTPAQAASGTSWASRLAADPALAWPIAAPAAGRLPDALRFFARLTEALEYVHRRGIVHCDVKPPNVFVGTNGHVTLLDFGLACSARKRRTGPDGDELCMGTMEYIAPEHLSGRGVDARADVYSLGCVLYELVTGRPPFHEDALEDIVRGHLDLTPTCPSTLVAGLPSALEDLILDMLAKNPGRRPRSAGVVAERVRSLRIHAV